MYNRHNQVQGRNTLRVIGEGTVLATPDQVQITLGVITLNENILLAQQENSAAMSAIIAAITELGVEDNQMQTVVYRIDPEYDYIEGVQVFRGYRVAHLLKITLEQVELAGSVIDVAVSNGANSITSIDFTVSDPMYIYNQALTTAVDNARQKANTLTTSLNVTLNPVPIQVTEVAKSHFPERFPTVLAAQATSTPIQPGQLTFEVSIEAVFTYL